jgi:hypothetical protein
MSDANIETAWRKVGQISCFMAFGFGMFYVLVTAVGLLSLTSPHEAIGDPYFTIMEILSILIALLMAVGMVAVHHYAAPRCKFYGFTALGFMFVTAGITSSVHFLVLSVSHTAEAGQLANFSFFFSFEWPSMVYALDILAWDLFFGLSMLFAAQVFVKNRFERTLKTLLIVSGILSLVGLMGVPLQNMQVRNIGIVGYAVVAPVAFLLMGIILGRTKEERD